MEFSWLLQNTLEYLTVSSFCSPRSSSLLLYFLWHERIRNLKRRLRRFRAILEMIACVWSQGIVFGRSNSKVFEFDLTEDNLKSLKSAIFPGETGQRFFKYFILSLINHTLFAILFHLSCFPSFTP